MSAVPESRLNFRYMENADLDAIEAAERHIYPFPWTRGNFSDSLRSGYRCWLCQRDGALAAYAVMMEIVEEVHLLNISVLPEFRRCGMASTLLEHLFTEARGSGAYRMLLEVRPSNAAGLAFYRHYGFTPVGRRRGYYPAENGREDAIVMMREL